MRDGRVLSAVEEMEAWLADPSWDPDPDALARWNASFQAARAQAEKGPGWAALMDRAHVAGRMLEARIADMVEAQQQVRSELESRELGHRALRGYGAGAR